jgi:uncharacterized protein
MRLLLLAVALVACTGENQGVEARRAALERVANGVLLPAYDSFQTKATALASATSTACGSSARAAWIDAHSEWKRIEAYRAGPIGRRRIDSAIDFWPVRRLAVDVQLMGTEPVTDEVVMTLGADERGLPVIELLLFEIDPIEPRRCEYAGALARDLVRQADAIVAAWSPAGENYLADFINAGLESRYYTTLQRAFDEVVNELIALAATIESMKLAKPLGKRDGGAPQPGSVEAPFAERSIDDIVQNLDGLERIYDAGISELVTAESAELDRQLRDALAKARSSALAIPTPLAQAVVENSAEVELLFLDVKEVHRLLSADLAALLGVTVTFSDNDGD